MDHGKHEVLLMGLPTSADMFSPSPRHFQLHPEANETERFILRFPIKVERLPISEPAVHRVAWISWKFPWGFEL